MSELLKEVEEIRRPLVATDLDKDGGRWQDQLQPGHSGQVTALVTVMEGCDNYCSYCIVPYVRGRERSRPADEIVDEVERLVDKGVREVTLIGQNVNSYGKKNGAGVNFAQLLDRIEQLAGLERIAAYYEQQARASRGSGDLNKALSEIEEGLKAYPRHSALMQLREKIKSEAGK